ncbi:MULTISPECIES: STAS domain-containing protein [unclassified Streptomyces]|uniref:STAS domain-containing protein n=1 Tax=unclassified Streptomyces TaxID=2593676 RepID=UPI000DC7EBF7|nr:MULTISPECIES: STAS domain-containing protein [unclassified Streptomyces]AWZ03345.1 anti-sigma factor antagonist [Streptomyces sp. ICC4]AWZ11115.1 anti-sigma factor antagonist [Streptomyces sp. ICC1]
MRVPDPNAHRYDESSRVLISPTGEIDLSTVDSLRTSLSQCLHDGVRTVDVDLSAVTFCDCRCLNVLLSAWWRITAAGGTLHLHHPPPVLVRMIDITRTGFLLGDRPAPALGVAL